MLEELEIVILGVGQSLSASALVIATWLMRLTATVQA